MTSLAAVDTNGGGGLRRWMGLALRLGISVGLLWLAVRNLSVDDMVKRLSAADRGYMVLAFAILLSITLLSSIRWRRVCCLLGCRLGRLEAWRVLMMANTLDQFLLNTSGDGIKIWWLNRRGPSMTHAVSGTILDRVVGAIALVLLIAAGLPILVTLDHVGEHALVPAAMVLAGLSGLAGLVAFNALPLPEFRFRANLAILSGATRDFFLRRPSDAIVAMAAALGVHVSVVLVFATIGAAIGTDLPFGAYLLAIPPAMLVALLPISVGGWGVREGTVGVALGLAGATPADALLTSVLFGLGVASVGITGGLVWLFGFPNEGKEPAGPEMV